MSARRTARLSLLAAVAAMVYPTGALAHATLLRSDPPNRSVVAKAPRAVRFVFNDTVEPVGGNEAVANADRKSILAGKPRLAKGGKVLVLPLEPGLRDGDYSVRWRVLSDDGHLISGVLAFAIGTGRAPPTAVLAAASGNPAALAVVSRWLLFAGLLVAAGAVAFSFLVLRPIEGALSLEQARRVTAVDRTRMSALVFAGSVLFVVGAAHFVHEQGSGTRFGAAVEVGLLVGVAAASCAALSLLHEAFVLPAAACGAALVAVPSFAGHSLDAGTPWPNVIVDLAHVAAAAVWLGSLVGLLLVLPAAARAAGEPGFASAVVRRVSAFALAGVALLVATGVVRAIFELSTISQLWTTGYGRALLVKIGLLLVLIGIGWSNRRQLDAIPRLRRSVAVEVALLAGVVVAVAFLTALRPGRTLQAVASGPAAASFAQPPPPPQDAVVLGGQNGHLAVGLAAEPDRFTITALAPSGSAADGLSVSIAGEPAKSCGHGCYSVRRTIRSRNVRVLIGGHPTRFTLPPNARPAGALLRRATHAFLALRSVRYSERISSGSTRSALSIWQLAAPNRVTYQIIGGPQAVVIGSRRWDRSPGKPWERSQISPLREPQPIWGTHVTNAHLLASDRTSLVLSWANPSIPAFFTGRFDRKTLLPKTLEMTAAAHFMEHRYLAFNRPLVIRPPAR